MTFSEIRLEVFIFDLMLVAIKKFATSRDLPQCSGHFACRRYYFSKRYKIAQRYLKLALSINHQGRKALQGTFIVCMAGWID